MDMSTFDKAAANRRKMQEIERSRDFLTSPEQTHRGPLDHRIGMAVSSCTPETLAKIEAIMQEDFAAQLRALAVEFQDL